jgi:endonuclease/exonuclease/phosphatase family metal-dependent hydrolase
MRADLICFQEVHGQEDPTRLRALETLLQGTPYQTFHIASTKTTAGDNYKLRNLVVASRFPLTAPGQILHDLVDRPVYKKLTAIPPEEPKEITWERPILYVQVQLPDASTLHVLNLHLKSKLPTNVDGQKDGFKWKTASGFAEGYFLSSIKRVGQALETRRKVDQIFDTDAQARIVVCGDFNADLDDVPIEAIRGRVENTENPDLISRVLLPAETSVAEPSRYTLFHHGRKSMLDHLLVSRSLLAFYRGTEILNEELHDESVAFAFDKKFPESDHAPVVADFQLP